MAFSSNEEESRYRDHPSSGRRRLGVFLAPDWVNGSSIDSMPESNYCYSITVPDAPVQLEPLTQTGEKAVRRTRGQYLQPFSIQTLRDTFLMSMFY